MKKIYTLMAFALLSGSISAQTKKEGVTFGAKAGVNLATLHASGNDVNGDPSSKSVTSFTLGGYASIPVSNKVSIQPGLSLSGKGGSDNEGGQKSAINSMYLEVPVNAVLNFNGFYFGAGPYVAYALSGKAKAQQNGVTVSADIPFGNNPGEFKRVDFGANALAGYQLKNNLNFGVNYGLGLTNIIQNGGADMKITNRVFSILVGYSF
jgi:hypothetical protein